MAVIGKLVTFYQELNTTSVAQLSDIYAESIEFIDPVATHEGLKQLAEYFGQLLEDTHYCRCSVTRVISEGDFHTMRWNMNFVHPRLNAGKEIQVEGLSEITVIGDKVVFQRDFYDLGEMVYQHVPVLKLVINSVKKRLAA